MLGSPQINIQNMMSNTKKYFLQNHSTDLRQWLPTSSQSQVNIDSTYFYDSLTWKQTYKSKSQREAAKEEETYNAFDIEELLLQVSENCCLPCDVSVLAKMLWYVGEASLLTTYEAAEVGDVTRLLSLLAASKLLLFFKLYLFVSSTKLEVSET